VYQFYNEKEISKKQKVSKRMRIGFSYGIRFLTIFSRTSLAK
jgi:hypothetical protein